MEKQNKKEKLAEYKERKITGGVYVIKNTANEKSLLASSTNLQGCKNRFVFSQKTNSCVDMKLQNDWKTFGAEAFQLEVLEELEKKDDQTSKEFAEDIKMLYELYLEKSNPEKMYWVKIE